MDAAGVWSQQQKLKASDAAENGYFAYVVDISYDGNTLVAGSPYNDVTGDNAGSAYIFNRTAGNWTEQEIIQTHSSLAGDWLGADIAITNDGLTLFASASDEDTPLVDAGAGYFYTRNTTPLIKTIIQDATPQLGGELDTNTFAITDATGVTINGETIHAVTEVETTDATQTVVKAISIAVGAVATFSLQGSGYEPATGDVFGFELRGCIKNIAGTTALVGATVQTVFKDAGAAGWLIDGYANDTTDELEIKVTGEIAHTIDWNFTMRTVEV